MDPEFFAAAAAGVASLLAVLGLRRRSATPATASDAVPGPTPGAALASAGAAASHNVSGAVASVGHQVLTLAAHGAGAAGAAVAKGAGLVVDGGVSLVEAVLPGKTPRPEPEAAPELTTTPTRGPAKRAPAKA